MPLLLEKTMFDRFDDVVPALMIGPMPLTLIVLPLVEMLTSPMPVIVDTAGADTWMLPLL